MKKTSKKLLGFLMAFALMTQSIGFLPVFADDGLVRGQTFEQIMETESGIVKLKSFKLILNNKDVTTLTEEELKNLDLTKDVKAQFQITFNLDLDGKEYKSGDYFYFTLPTQVNNFGNFSGESKSQGKEPVFEYKPSDVSGQIIKVSFKKGMDLEEMSSKVLVTLNFESTLKLNGEGLDQGIEVPDPNDLSKSKTITLTFKPTTSDEKMSKNNKGFIIENGKRYINWEIWVNKAGKYLDGATITDTPGASPSHKFRLGSLEVTKGISINLFFFYCCLLHMNQKYRFFFEHLHL